MPTIHQFRVRQVGKQKSWVIDYYQPLNEHGYIDGYDGTFARVEKDWLGPFTTADIAQSTSKKLNELGQRDIGWRF